MSQETHTRAEHVNAFVGAQHVAPLFKEVRK